MSSYMYILKCSDGSYLAKCTALKQIEGQIE